MTNDQSIRNHYLLYFIVLFSFLLALFFTTSSYSKANEWQPVTGKQALAAVFTDTELLTNLNEKVEATASYRADGTGEVRAWGQTFSRQWRVEGEDKLCITMQNKEPCFTLEKSTTYDNLYRAKNLDSGQQIEFTVANKADGINLSGKTAATDKTAAKGGAAKPSVDEIAAELSNPNTSLASLSLKFQYRAFEGDLPNADDQDSMTVLFQPTLPFKREDGSIIAFRPAIPFIVDQPLYEGGGNWSDESGLGDISFDLAYALAPRKDNPGWLTAVGLFSSLPTGDKDLGFGESTTLGPEFLVGEIYKKGIWLVFPSHQWDVGGDIDVSLTTVQAGGLIFGSNGWVYGSTPTMSYNHETDEATIPVNFIVSKTVVLGGRPWKFGGEINYYIDKPDDFGPKWLFSFSVTPVVKNVFADLFK